MKTPRSDSRIFVVEAIGLSQPGILRTGVCRFKVPYQSLARTIQLINRRGGEIVRVTALSAVLSEPAQEPDLQLLSAPDEAGVLVVELVESATQSDAVKQTQPMLKPKPAESAAQPNWLKQVLEWLRLYPPEVER
jgi:hypothetical protein